eukprot:TRINITY_DN16219_c0_g1_i2.p2 TRINITY_DN16219_c0_g1~~TRINITY_DN16219_c0_g1_i2.p2  ORF type:complete len:128 (+),score=32.38 TRINITY_DN16219_c0_g1_i2:2-385(+)
MNFGRFASKINSNSEFGEIFQQMKDKKAISLEYVLKYAITDKWMEQTYEIIARECGETRVEYVGFGHYKYRIVECKVSVGHLFGMVEDMKARIPIVDYSVMQTTLEEVFNQFAALSDREQTLSLIHI